MIFRRGNIVRVRVSALIIENNRVLLIAHKKKNNVYWLLPGGGVGFGETLRDALVRELEEELAISLEVGELLFVADSINRDERRHIINMVFRGTRRNGDLHLGNDHRLYTFKFFSREELAVLRIFPPLTEEIGAFMAGTPPPAIYRNKDWIPL